MTEERKTGKKRVAARVRVVRFLCPYCREPSNAARTAAGSIVTCPACAEQCRVPKARLSVNGRLPLGLKLGEEPFVERSTAESAVSLPEEHEPQPLPPGRRNRSRSIVGWLGSALGVLIVCGLGVVLLIRTGTLDEVHEEPSAQEPSAVRPSREVVFAAVDLWHQRLRRMEFSIEVLEGDVGNLALLQALSAERDMSREERVFKEGIERRRAAIRDDVRVLGDIAIELHGYLHEWESYVGDLLDRAQIDATGKSDADRAANIRLLVNLITDTGPGATQGGARLRSKLEDLYLGDLP